MGGGPKKAEGRVGGRGTPEQPLVTRGDRVRGRCTDLQVRLHEEPELPEMKGRMDSLAYQHVGHEVRSPTSSTPACVPVTSAPSDKGR